MGLPIVERWQHRGVTWVMAGDRTRIGLWKPQVGFAGGQPGAHVHFAMHIREEDYDPLVERLRAQGCDVTEYRSPPPREGRAVYVSDADGHCIEFWSWDVAGHLDAIDDVRCAHGADG